MINLPFFLLPFCLFFSVFTNAIGYYFFLLLYPLILVKKQKIKIPNYVKEISLILFIMYVCFSISNVLNFFFPNSIMPFPFYRENFSFFKIFKSRLPTSYFTTSIFLIVLYYSSKHYLKYHSQESALSCNKEFFNIKPLESFFKGSLYAGIFFLIFYFLEYSLKIHYRNIIYNFDFLPDKSLLNQVNRPTGLLANPLTLASMSLAFFTFFYTYFCYSFFSDQNKNSLPFSQNKKKLILYTFVPGIIFLIILFFTLARTAILISFCILILIPFVSSPRKKFIKVFIFVTSFSIFAYFICDMLGYIDRIMFSIQQLNQNGHMDNRYFFREIYFKMFLNKPWIGNGNYWIENGIRDQYFVKLGYANLDERNFPAHNLYLEILASGGVFCASFIVYGIFRLKNIIKTHLMNRNLGNHTLWIAYMLTFISNLGHAFTQNNFLESSTTYTYFYILFIIFWEQNLRRQQQ